MTEIKVTNSVKVGDIIECEGNFFIMAKKEYKRFRCNKTLVKYRIRRFVMSEQIEMIKKLVKDGKI